MDIELLTVDEIAHELARRELPYVLLLPPNNKTSHGENCQFHAYGLPPDRASQLLQEAVEVFDTIIEGGTPENVNIIHRLMGDDGEIIEEREIKFFEDEDDPWS